MANESTNNAKKEKFIGLLHELFQLNQPELDFGLYRIMHAKSDQIKAFIQNDLASEIDDAFSDSGDDKIAELKASYEQARAQAVEFGIPEPDSNPKVKQAKEAYDAARDNGDDSSDIYDRLYRFFSRYYDKGDFLSRRYHVGENESRAAPYAVPYDGREVYLHWANKDQYYIKSSEYLSNFSFELQGAIEKERKRQGLSGQGSLGLDESASNSGKVTFQLVDAAESAHNNVKENQARYFILHADKPVEVRPFVSAQGETEGYELIINFEYRPDPEKSGQEGGWQKKRLQEAETAILEALKADDNLRPFYDALGFLAPTEKDKARTLLAKYLTSYTARNTMDYFIHKDLGGFLRRELDFYIKNEIMRLDDLSNDDIVGVTHSLRKITALRSISRQIIDFLAQLENFQKKLWLKKKFVTEVNYCITLDRVPESFYEEILGNEKQWHEWEKLGFIDQPEPSIEALKKKPFMMLDTGFFESTFKERLLSEIDDLDELLSGTLINSENFQALNLMQAKYAQSIPVIYIDPPYNTVYSKIAYKNDFEHSSWLSLISNTLPLSKKLFSEDFSFGIAIDDYELVNLTMLVDQEFPNMERSRVVVNHHPQGSGGRLSRTHEYYLLISDDGLPAYKGEPVDDGVEERAFMRSGRGENNWRQHRWKSFYALLVDTATMMIVDAEEPIPLSESYPTGKTEEGYTRIYPINSRGEERVWRSSYETGKKRAKNGELIVSQSGTVYQVINHQGRRETLFSNWTSSDFNAGTQGTAILENLGLGGIFDYPKSIKTLEKGLWAQSFGSEDALVLDYFGGSGTTAHAVINMNRDYGGNRKYLIVEMGDYFSTVLKPRVQKAVFAKSWQNGKPLIFDENNQGISHCFKYIQLESYEDTVNNLMIPSESAHDVILSKKENQGLRKDYFLNYLLDVGTRGSASLLNLELFSDPTAYNLMVKRPGSDTRVPVNVDLVETFNWLIGMQVALLDRPRTYDVEFQREHDPELPEDQHTRLQVKRFKEDDQGEHWFRVVEGYVCRTPGSDANKDKVMVIWRKLTDDSEKDAAALEALLSKYRVNQSDSEYDKIYINGSHGLSLSGQAKVKLLSLEETFMARMWEDTDGAMH